MGFYPVLRTVVVVLSNADAGVSDIDLRLLNSEIWMTRVKQRHTEAAVEP